MKARNRPVAFLHNQGLDVSRRAFRLLLSSSCSLSVTLRLCGNAYASSVSPCLRGRFSRAGWFCHA